jgi:hypothetical protein
MGDVVPADAQDLGGQTGRQEMHIREREESLSALEFFKGCPGQETNLVIEHPTEARLLGSNLVADKTHTNLLEQRGWGG